MPQLRRRSSSSPKANVTMRTVFQAFLDNAPERSLVIDEKNEVFKKNKDRRRSVRQSVGSNQTTKHGYLESSPEVPDDETPPVPKRSKTQRVATLASQARESVTKNKEIKGMSETTPSNGQQRTQPSSGSNTREVLVNKRVAELSGRDRHNISDMSLSSPAGQRSSRRSVANATTLIPVDMSDISNNASNIVTPLSTRSSRSRRSVASLLAGRNEDEGKEGSRFLMEQTAASIERKRASRSGVAGTSTFNLLSPSIVDSPSHINQSREVGAGAAGDEGEEEGVLIAQKTPAAASEAVSSVEQGRSHSEGATDGSNTSNLTSITALASTAGKTSTKTGSTSTAALTSFTLTPVTMDRESGSVNLPGTDRTVSVEKPLPTSARRNSQPLGNLSLNETALTTARTPVIMSAANSLLASPTPQHYRLARLPQVADWQRTLPVTDTQAQGGARQHLNNAKPTQAKRRAQPGPRKTRTATDSGVPMSKQAVSRLFKRYSKLPVTRDAIDQVMTASEQYWAQMIDDVSTYAQHAGRQTIKQEDMELLFRRQGYVKDGMSLESLIRQHLPYELRCQLIPCAYADGVVLPAPKKTSRSKCQQRSLPTPALPRDTSGENTAETVDE